MLVCAAMRLVMLSLAALTLSACTQGYVTLPPFPDSGPVDATASDAMPALDGGEDSTASEEGGDAQGDAPSEGSTTDGPAADGPAFDGATEAGDASDAAAD
jgi:hypothetical protein